MEILPQLLVNSLITGSIYALASSGLALSYGVLRILNFAHGHTMMLGAYLFFLMRVEWMWGVGASALGAGLLLVLFSILVLEMTVLPVNKYSELLPLVTTLALSIVLEAGISIGFGVGVKSIDSGSMGVSLELGSVFITPLQISICAGAILLLMTLAIFIHLTPYGRRIRALSQNRFASESIGISTRASTYLVFSIGVLLAGLSGVLIAYETNLQPTMGNSYTIKAFATMILGGLGSVWGAVLGSFLLGAIENLSIGLDWGGYSLPSGYKDAFAFVLILGMLLVRPRGLLGKRVRAT